jgi:nickel/cobalt exporter
MTSPMTFRIRRLMGALVVAIATASVAMPAAAHPLGNATVSRGVAATLSLEAIEIDYIVDMAEIPAFATIQAVDTDGDGAVSTDEAAAYVADACDEAVSGLEVMLDNAPLELEPANESTISFPPGVGGLETVRLECHAVVSQQPGDEGSRHVLRIADRRDDGRPGWREVTIRAASGISLLDADVPSTSPSAGLTVYPEDLLAAPIDVRAGMAVFEMSRATAPGTAAQVVLPPPSSDPLATLLTGSATGGGVGTLIALLVSMGLGAAHALSPGHGKALVAAALVGSRGTARQAAGLGLTVAASHTIGVLALGLVVLAAGAALAPDLVLAWMSLVAGGCVVVVGSALLARAAVRVRRHENGHASHHVHPHPHGHPQPRAHAGGPPREGLATRSIIGLGLFGGLVPSSSAIIVLLLAVTTGQLVLGLALIAAFGIGMAGVLGGFAIASTWLGGRVLGAEMVAHRPTLARIGQAVPVVSAVAVVAAGTMMTMGALTQVL